jgi:uncharacterized small protein (DUF1192 family)
MNRLLIVGKKLPRLACIEWAEIDKYNLLDFQGLLIDCRHGVTQSQQQRLAQIIGTYPHRVYVILPRAADLSTFGAQLNFIGGIQLSIWAEKGRTVRAKHAVDPFDKYLPLLDGYEVCFSMNHAPGHYLAIVNNVGHGLCGGAHNALVFHPPAPTNENSAFQILLTHFGPDFEEPEPQPPPDWAAAVIESLPGVRELDERIGGLQAQIGELGQRVSSEKERRRGIESWAEMLWLDGIPLQNRVKEALRFLGISAESSDPTAHDKDLEAKCAGHKFLMEVTGSVGPIGIEKGRQLFQWMAQSDDPATVKGVLIGNAFRTDPPDRRPPPNQRIFVRELEQMAERFRFALLDVRELFGLVTAKLSGASIEANAICDELSGAGIIKFHVGSATRPPAGESEAHSSNDPGTA